MSGPRHLLALLGACAFLVASPVALQILEPAAIWHWGMWAATSDRTRPPSPAPERPLGPFALDEQPEDDPTRTERIFTYDLWQWCISSLSGLGPFSPIHGRLEVLRHAEEIRYWAHDDLELLVAASIAHQASDFKDRPFGTDALEVIWRELIDDNISVGIAQLRQAEVWQWTPFLHEADPLAPEMAIRIMSAKLRQANAYILQKNPDTSLTNRYMLLALAQNAAAFSTIRNTVDHFHEVAFEDWNVMLGGDLARAWGWQKQLRLVLLHIDWLVEQGWEIPEGLDLAYWSRVAFATP